MQAMEQRVVKMEAQLARMARQNLVLRLFLVALIGLAIAGAKWDVPDVLQTRSLEILDTNGKKRASISAASGKPAMTLFDANGTKRASLFLDNEPELMLYRSNGFAWGARLHLAGKSSFFDLGYNGHRVLATADEEKGSLFKMVDKDNHERVEMLTEPAGTHISVGDSTGVERVKLTGWTTQSSISCNGPGKRSAWLGSIFTPAITLKDKNGNVTWKAPP